MIRVNQKLTIKITVMKTLKLSLASLLFLGSVVLTNAQNTKEAIAPSDKEEVHKKHHEEMMKELNLTEEQKVQMEAARKMHKEDVEPIKAELKIKEAKLKELKSQESPSIDEANSLIDEIHTLKAQKEKLKFVHHQQVNKILTPEQRIKMKELHAEKRAAKQKHHHMQKH